MIDRSSAQSDLNGGDTGAREMYRSRFLIGVLIGSALVGLVLLAM
jgi:hypothetical protein